ncbi:MAG: ABC transporter permease [Candidatus Nitrosothermus koennekii]|nr:MAG: ABC transporter permease [Candidatus Nitrosothermus koennekii]
MIRSSIIKKLIFYAIIVIIWHSIYLADVVPELILPSPFQVGESLGLLIINGTLPYAIGTSFIRLLIGFIIAISIGFALGYYMAKYKTVYDTLGSLVLGLQSIPSMAWVPIGLIWFGINDMGIIFVIIASTIFSVAMSTYTGIKNVPPIYIKAATNMGAKGFTLLYEVVLPAALPYLISGLRQAWSFAWRGLISAEMLFALLGVGFLLIAARNIYDMAQVIAIMLVIMGIGLAMDSLIFSRIERKIAARYGMR